jgi:SAM-dependent methyltransferase
MNDDGLYASPRTVTDPRECLFYHTMDVPGHGTVSGPWDLRSRLDPYLGGVAFAGKRVLDVGTANGCLSFHMEQRGAEVVSYDLSEAYSWDHVPYAGTDLIDIDAGTKGAIRKINNGYWFCHRAYRSKNRLVHGTVYTIPDRIGPVDIGVYGSMLMHVRDPFLALQNGLRLVKDTAIVAETIPRRRFWQRFVAPLLSPQMMFLPDARTRCHPATWWVLPPKVIQRFLGVLGFEDTKVTYHSQKFEGATRLLYTVVGRRTKPAPVLTPARAASCAA